MTEWPILPGQFLDKKNGRVHPQPLLPRRCFPREASGFSSQLCHVLLSALCLVRLLFLIPFPLWFPSQLVRPLRTWCLKHPLRFEASVPFFLCCRQEMKKRTKPQPSPQLERAVHLCSNPRGNYRWQEHSSPCSGDSAPLVLRNPQGWTLPGSRVLS